MVRHLVLQTEHSVFVCVCVCVCVCCWRLKASGMYSLFHDRACVRVRSNYCALGGCLLSLSLCRSGFQDFYTSLRKGVSHLIHNSLTSPRHAPYLLHALHSLFLHSEPPLTCHPPSYRLRLFLSQTFSCINTPTFLNPVTLHTTCLWRWNRQSVAKCRHIKFRCRGITQKKS